MKDSSPSFAKIISAWIPACMEAVLFLMIFFSPWVYGARHPEFEFFLAAGTAVLLTLWAARMLLEWRLTWEMCPVALALALLLLLGLWQILPWSGSTLSWLSPSSAKIHHQLFPDQPEVLPGGETILGGHDGGTISLVPGATARHLFRVLAVLLVFAAVRNNLEPVPVLRRLCLLALVNGFLLSFFGIIQFLSSGPHLLYWSIPTAGSVFGPFVYRNHFAFYVNLCLGLGVGFVLCENARAKKKQGAYTFETDGDWRTAISSMLRQPRNLWIALALAVMVAGVFFSLSRGGMIALLGAGFLCGLGKWLTSGRSPRIGVLLVSIVAALSMAGWLGWGTIQSRLATLLDSKTLEISRLSLWTDLPTVIRDYPVWGVGFGSYMYVEPMYRSKPYHIEFAVDHLHNEYLEALVEGGPIALAISLWAIGLVFWFGWKAVRRHGEGSTSGLVWGVLLSFTALVLHSIGEFGVHSPAIAVLATVFCALLVSLGSRAKQSQTAEQAGEKSRFSFGGPMPIVGAGICLVLGFMLVNVGWRENLSERLQRAAFRLGQTPTVDNRKRQVEYLESAVRLAPWDVEAHSELAIAAIDLYEAHQSQRAQNHQVILVAQGAAISPPGNAEVARVAALAWWSDSLFRQEKSKQAKSFLEHAFRYLGQARASCPLKVDAHLLLATHIRDFAQADTRATYLQRAQWLAPMNPHVWMISGEAEFQAGNFEQAWKCWRTSLDLSPRYLHTILIRAGNNVATEDLFARVLPDNPQILVLAGEKLFPLPENADQREPFLRRAEKLLENRPATQEIPDLELHAQILRTLNKKPEARAIFEELLGREPQQLKWRLQIAQLFHEENRLQDARRELHFILAQDPTNKQAQALLTKVATDMAAPR